MNEAIVREIKDLLENEMDLCLIANWQCTPSYYPEAVDGARFRLPCCYLSKKNAYQYGEDCPRAPGEDFHIDNARLKEYIAKYPTLFALEDCSYCCGCGDW